MMIHSPAPRSHAWRGAWFRDERERASSWPSPPGVQLLYTEPEHDERLGSERPTSAPTPLEDIQFETLQRKRPLDEDGKRAQKAFSKRDCAKYLKEKEHEANPELVEVRPHARCTRCTRNNWRCFVELDPLSPRRVCRPCGKNKCSFGNSDARPATYPPKPQAGYAKLNVYFAQPPIVPKSTSPGVFPDPERVFASTYENAFVPPGREVSPAFGVPTILVPPSLSRSGLASLPARMPGIRLPGFHSLVMDEGSPPFSLLRSSLSRSPDSAREDAESTVRNERNGHHGTERQQNRSDNVERRPEMHAASSTDSVSPAIGSSVTASSPALSFSPDAASPIASPATTRLPAPPSAATMARVPAELRSLWSQYATYYNQHEETRAAMAAIREKISSKMQEAAD